MWKCASHIFMISVSRFFYQLMREYHQMNTMVPQDGRIPESANDVAEDLREELHELVKTKEPAKEDVTQPVATAEPETVKEEPRPSAGLASAVAASKTVKSNVTKKLKPKEVSGVTRL